MTAQDAATSNDHILGPAMDGHVPDDGLLSPGEMAERTGLPLDTLRYYEAEGLLVDVPRAPSGHRRYRRDDVVWVEVLRCLRTSGMTMQQLRDYAALVQAGPSTEVVRLELLQTHRADVVARIADLQDSLDVIDHKIAVYGTALDLD